MGAIAGHIGEIRPLSNYHKDGLRDTLLVAAEEQLIEGGVERFSLRGCAKRAGVSHAAPAHHFKDTASLLQALAGIGFSRMAKAMADEMERAEPDHQDQLVASGLGYVGFAISNPQLFSLMFGGYVRQIEDKELQRNSDATFSILVNAIAKLRGQTSFRTESGWRDVTAVWSLVHGYAQLSVAGKMEFATGRPFDEQRVFIADMLKRIVSTV